MHEQREMVDRERGTYTFAVVENLVKSEDES